MNKKRGSARRKDQKLSDTEKKLLEDRRLGKDRRS